MHTNRGPESYESDRKAGHKEGHDAVADVGVGVCVCERTKRSDIIPTHTISKFKVTSKYLGAPYIGAPRRDILGILEIHVKARSYLTFLRNRSFSSRHSEI